MRQFLQSAASLIVPLILLGAIVIAVQPWGDYPLNDDWWYARAAQHFAGKRAQCRDCLQRTLPGFPHAAFGCTLEGVVDEADGDGAAHAQGLEDHGGRVGELLHGARADQQRDVGAD